MKKIYQRPSVSVNSVHTTQMMAVSINKYDSGADNVVLTKQDNGWDLWGDDNDFDN